MLTVLTSQKKYQKDKKCQDVRVLFFGFTELLKTMEASKPIKELTRKKINKY